MTKLEALCELHGQSGGTIHQFNKQYGIDFLLTTNFQFKLIIRGHFGYHACSKYEIYFPTESI